MTLFFFNIISPNSGAEVGRNLSLTGVGGDSNPNDPFNEYPKFRLNGMSVQFGPSGPFVEATLLSNNGASTAWRAVGSLPAGIGPNQQVVLTAVADAIRTENHGTETEPDPVDVPFTATRTVTVITEHSFPQVGFDPYPHDVTPPSLPFTLALTGTATDVQSGITVVKARVDNGAQVTAQNVSGDWSHWAVNLPIATVGDHMIRADATDGLGNVGTWSDTITVKANVAPTPMEQAFAVPRYLEELLGTASRYLRLDGASTGPTPANLSSRLHQPLDRLGLPAQFAPATADVAQARVAVEVLRGAMSPAAPAALDQRYRGQAYEAILRELGTSSEELRLARTADSRTRHDLAARLGIGLEGTRLDALTISPDAITDAQLEQLLGYRTTNPSDPLAVPAPAVVPQWQQDQLQTLWQEADAVQRDRIGAPYPIIDPDVISEGHLRNPAAVDPAHALWVQRRNFVQAQVTDLTQRFSGSARTAAGFDPALAAAGLTIDLPGLSARDKAGDDVSVEVSALGLTVEAFRFLTRIRELLAAGTVTESEWQDVVSILVQMRKRRVFANWRRDERQSGVVLQPSSFVVDSPDDPVTFTGPMRWRADWSTLADWRRTLTARQRQSDATGEAYRAVVRAAEKQVLPVLRDALLAEIGGRATPPQPAAQVAERLSRELSVDFLAAAGIRTSRVIQAVDSLQSLLIAARSGALPAATGGHSATVSDEGSFDAEWAWLETYARWRAAMHAFAYPESRLLPSLFVPDNAGAGRVLAPTNAFTAFMFGPDQISGLVNRSRLTPDDAIVLARDYLSQVRSETGAALAGVVLTNRRSNVELEAHREICVELTFGMTQEKLIPQHLREVFWLVPVALARKLQDCGHYAEALDWYQSVFAYHLPPAHRFIYSGLSLEQSITSTFGRLPEWLPLVRELNPHLTGRNRKGAYTKFTIMSIVDCFLDFADSEFARNAIDSNARARALYQTAADLIALQEALPETGGSNPFPANPVWQTLKTRADSGLTKIHAGLNLAGQTDLAPTTDNVLPSSYRYSVLAERAKTLVTIAQQVESAYLSALERADGANYDRLRADHDLRTAAVALTAQDLRVDATEVGVEQAGLQRDRAQTQFGTYNQWIKDGLNTAEKIGLAGLGLAAALHTSAALVRGVSADSFWKGGEVASAVMSSAAAAASTAAQIAQTTASYERREQEWKLSRAIAGKDLQLAESQINQAGIQKTIAERERDIAAEQLDHAGAVVEFLATKFTSAALYEWMSGVLGRVYAYFLQQATAVAQLAQAQLAFERQEPVSAFIAADYWQPAAVNGGQPATDRRGITGSARLLQDIFQLDQHAFDTDRRKLHVSQTIAVSQLAGYEMQQFRETGVLTFTTPQELYDADFPGHYLRLVKRVSVSLIALLPVGRGLRGTLFASGVSRTVVSRGSFETVTLRREPESIAVTAPMNATGMFALEPENSNGMLLPFEGMGVDTVWQLELPKAANPFDYRTIAEVLLTIEYTALSSPEYRQTVIRSLNRGFTGDRSFSLRTQFPDVWYDLNNPDTVEDPANRMRAVLPLTADDFPLHIADLAVSHVTLFAVRGGGLVDELTIPALRHTAAGQTTAAGQVRTVGGIVGTRRPGGAPWQALLGATPVGSWELVLENTPAVRSLFTSGQIEDLVLVFTLSGTTPEWP